MTSPSAYGFKSHRVKNNLGIQCFTFPELNKNMRRLSYKSKIPEVAEN
jgi:hypothetical protein